MAKKCHGHKLFVSTSEDVDECLKEKDILFREVEGGTMKTILEGNSNIHSLIGEQAVRDTEYRLMKYTLKFEIDGGLLLHNVITGRLVYVTDEEKKILNQIQQVRFSEELSQLIAWYYFVPNDFDEYAFVNGYRKILQLLEKNKEKPIVKYTIFPTTCCNAHCFYCFESEYRKINMDKNTALNVADFICRNSRNNPVKIGWFGGEPTLGMHCIDIICGSLREHGVNYESSMVSNGYLFTEDLVTKAVAEWKLKNIQITLDGTEEIYNRTKNYSVEGSAYKRVLNNIRILLEAGVHVNILLNLDYHNADDLHKLVDELADRFHSYKNLRVSSHVLFNDEGYEKVHHTKEEEVELAQKNYNLADHMKKKGLNGDVMGVVRNSNKLPVMRYLYCMANDSGAIVIGPNGSFYNCEHIDKDLVSTAGINNDTFSQQEIDQWFENDEQEGCSECSLYPECFIPKACKNHSKCYPIDMERRITRYSKVAAKLFLNTIHDQR